MSVAENQLTPDAGELGVVALLNGVWRWRPDLNTACWSAAFADLTGLEVRSRDGGLEMWAELAHPTDADTVREALTRCSESREPVDLSCRISDDLGRYRWVRVRGDLVDEPAEGASQVVLVIQDVHDLHVAAEVAREKEQLFTQQQRMEAIDCLAAGIAHEFNNVLQAVGGYVSFARDEMSPESQAFDDLTQAMAACDRAAKLTRGLLDFARAADEDQGRTEINEVVTGLVDLLRPVIGEDIKLKLSASELPLVTTANVLDLRQALLNMCINARHAMPKGGSLCVSAEPFRISPAHGALIGGLPTGDYCRLFVTDTGIGISRENLGRVFDPFFTTKEAGTGTGLGLAAVYGFVQRSGGHVAVYSDGDGAGTTFTIYLPVEGFMLETANPAGVETGGEDAPATILFAEDDPAVRDVGVRLLEQAGYNVLCEVDGEAALETFVAQADSISMVILDAVMPRMSGREVFEQIRRLQSTVPIVFCTGYDPESKQASAYGSSVDAVLAKPFDLAQLLGVAERLIGASSGTENA